MVTIYYYIYDKLKYYYRNNATMDAKSVRLELFVSHDFKNPRLKFLSDIDLICEGKCFPAHKVILCSVSDFFITVFNNKFRVTNDSKLVLTDVSPKTLEQYLNYIYGERELTFTDWRDAMDFFDFMDFTQTQFDYNNDLFNIYNVDNFPEYLSRLKNFFCGKLPTNILIKSARHINNESDLNSLDSSILKIIFEQGKFRLNREDILQLQMNLDPSHKSWEWTFNEYNILYL